MLDFIFFLLLNISDLLKLFELDENLIDLAILSSKVVKNSDASSCVPTPNTFEISN
jgi:hypothetical protein